MKPFLTDPQFGQLSLGGRLRVAPSLVASFVERLVRTLHLGERDLLFVQLEAMFFGPAIFERVYSEVGRLPMVLDLDDATYLHYVSPTYGRLGTWVKFFGKPNKLTEGAAVVTCGNRSIAEYVEGKGTRSVVVPAVVDLEGVRIWRSPVEQAYLTLSSVDVVILAAC